MTDDADDDIAQVFQAEERAMQMAHAHFEQYNPFLKLPAQVTLRVLKDYRKALANINITGAEASMMIGNDLHKCALALRGMTAGMLYLGSARHAVLLHVGLLIGVKALCEHEALWVALRARNYEKAHDELMLTDWPRLVGDELDERRRVLDLARILRTGILSLQSAALH